MTDRYVIRIDATESPAVRVGDSVRKGQNLCAGTKTGISHVSPIAGVVEEVRFDPAQHEFVISVSPEKA
ncbi:MAG: hypothetical protein RBR19_00790 [Sedimentisphaerales bacterium]|jgi:Na+-translocating ferredoxin:NAD+ oxidoreductase RnfC subunit|nr:hypothetical protein [Planctomycetota bacterium]MDY0354385.1 hypothetical protein [Sedimentisphaerales bacterium]NLT77044.1 hypothetical protein [Planctomycetota bacterium]